MQQNVACFHKMQRAVEQTIFFHQNLLQDVKFGLHDVYVKVHVSLAKEQG